MSSFMVSDECINRVLAFINEDEYTQRGIKKAGFNEEPFLESLGAEMRRLNAIALWRRKRSTGICVPETTEHIEAPIL